MPTRRDRTGTTDGNTRTELSVPAEPKSFSPHPNDPAVPNAWESLRSLSAASSKANFPVEEMFALARKHIDARNLRYVHLPKPMFGEPGWDMLLSLYVTFRSEARQTITNLCAASGGAATTALRWIDYLERQGFVTRRANPLDLRVVFVELTATGRDAIEAYLVDLLERNAAGAARI